MPGTSTIPRALTPAAQAGWPETVEILGFPVEEGGAPDAEPAAE